MSSSATMFVSFNLGCAVVKSKSFLSTNDLALGKCRRGFVLSKPLKTALAKQCPHCNMDWYDPRQPKRLAGVQIVCSADLAFRHVWAQVMFSEGDISSRLTFLGKS